MWQASIGLVIVCPRIDFELIAHALGIVAGAFSGLPEDRHVVFDVPKISGEIDADNLALPSEWTFALVTTLSGSAKV
jgi:hypothetical protein